MILRYTNFHKLFIIAGVIVLFWWPISSLIGQANDRDHVDEVTRLLYQVSLFQMELLSSGIQAATSEISRDQLETLKQSAYSVLYTHERLSAATDGRLPEFDGIDEMMEYMMRLQMGGSDILASEATAVFNDAAPMIAQMHEAYSKLISSQGDLISSSLSALEKHDRDVYDLFHKKLFE